MNTFSSISTTKRETIKVCIRWRPWLAYEDMEFWTVDKTDNIISSMNCTSNNNSKIVDSIYSPQQFQFDKIYTHDSSSQLIYKENCREITKNLIMGLNGSVFTYGQTTSGKTFTMLGNPQNPGILPCVWKDLFDWIYIENTEEEKNKLNQNKEHPEPTKYKVYWTYVEIYNEIVHDLLTDANSLKLIDDSKYGVIVSGAKKIQIKSFEEGIKVKDFGEENRHYRATMINEYSSRSHTIFQIFLEYSSMNEESNTITSRYSLMNLVDLAGSEKMHEGDTTSSETGYINKSLLALTNVISKLAEGNRRHIPYRDSKWTRLTSMALGGNSYITIVVNISPSANNYFQTLSSLRFACRAKIVKVKPNINEFYNEKEMIEIYRQEILKLQQENSVVKEENKENLNVIDNQRDKVCDDIELSDYKMKYYNEVIKNKRLKLENEKWKQEMTDMICSSWHDKKSIVNIGDNTGKNFISSYVNQILQSKNMNPNGNNWTSYFNSLINQIDAEYKEQLNTLQNFYIQKLKNINMQTLPSSKLEISRPSNVQEHCTKNSNSNNNSFYLDIKQKKIFNNVLLTFSLGNKSIPSIKSEYEIKADKLEQEMNGYKQYMNEYYSDCLNQFRNDVNSQKMVNDEFNECVKILNELYEEKQGELEAHFFETLRKITSINK